MKEHNKYYWEDRNKRASAAKQHTKLMDQNYAEDIKHCVAHTQIYSEDFHHPVTSNKTQQGSISFEVAKTDTISALYNNTNKEHGHIALLNFASYKEPGGRFLNGSRAQEECLCHESFLYNVLREFEATYYEANRNDLNRGLYRNRALYSPDVIFVRNNQERKCDVITCAAPNFSVAERFISREENNKWLRKRINFILEIAKSEHVDTLILGAFGCGVFQQDPKVVSKYFVEEAQKVFVDANIHIIFAVIPSLPNQTDNLTPFVQAVDDWNRKH